MSLLREAERCLANQATHASLNAFISPTRSSGPWRERVAEADARHQKAAARSPLDGRLIAVKDNICTRDLPTTCASKMLETFTSPFNATVVDSLEGAGAIIAGKTNLDEFGMGSHSMNSHFGMVKNHIQAGDDTLSPGGSSGGSAVAVATDQCRAALGTDTGGSVRLPAAYTGTVGFKPSYGLLSRWGVIAYANSLDTVGVIGKTVSTVRDVFKTINHHDSRDPTSLSVKSRTRIFDQIHAATSSRKTLRIGIPLDYNIHELTPSVRAAWLRALNHLQQQGHTLHAVALPATRAALPAYYVLAPAEASSNLAKFDGVRYGTRDPTQPDNAGAGYLYAATRGAGFGPEVRRRILLGTFSLSADAMDNFFIQAQKVRRLVQADFDATFALPNPLLHSHTTAAEHTRSQATAGGPVVDVLVCPTAPSPPPTTRAAAAAAPVEAYINDVFTAPASLAGLPAISVPVPLEGRESRLGSAGIQVIGQFGDDDSVLGVGELIEELTQ